MRKSVLSIVLLFVLIGAEIAMSQHSDLAEIRVLMLTGKKLLAKGDSIGAKEKFEAVLRLDPESQSAKFLLESLSHISVPKEEVTAIEPTQTIETTPMVESTANKEASTSEGPTTYEDSDATEDLAITEEPTDNQEPEETLTAEPRDPFAGAIRHKTNKTNTPTNTVKDSTSGNHKQGSATNNKNQPSSAKSQNQRADHSNDILYSKYYSTKGPHLLHFSDLPTAPLYGCSKAQADADINGRWMSSIRNMRDNGHEMLTLTVDAPSGTIEYDPSRSELLLICASNGFDISGMNLTASDDAINGAIEVSSTATNRQEIIGITDILLRPFLGDNALSDYQTYRWMVEGDLVTDTIITTRIEYITGEPNDSTDTTEPLPLALTDLMDELTQTPDSIIITDTTYVKRRVIPDHYDVSVRLDLDIKKADKLLPGALKISAVAIAPTRTITIAEAALPITFVHVPDGYDWHDQGRHISSADSAWYSNLKASPMDMHNINNLGYALLNGKGTEADHSEAKKMFDRAHKLKSKEACANLYLMYRYGIGTEADIDGAMSLLEAGRQRELPELLYQSARLMRDIGVTDDTMTGWLDEAVKLDNPSATIMKAKMTNDGSADVQDTEETLRLYTRARDLGHPEAGYYMARMMLDDDSLSQAYISATESARAGSVQAMQMIAEMYITGIVVRQDMRKAVMWLDKLQKAVQNQEIGYLYEKHDIN